ncbi:MAG TPA: MFS transporter [Casimicrobiaceae bacterium]|nr:MFS transporter [Casimicrobiaceae bacterium]
MPASPTDQNTNPTVVFLSSCVAMLAVGVNGTAIMAALPTMRTELALGPAGVQWTINAYLVVSAACIVMGGAAADRFGARKTAMVGLALFAIASSLIAIAEAEATVLAARALQGIGAALAVPSTLADVRITAPPERQGSAIGAWTGFLMLGFSVGPVIGGALTHFTSWRVIFWLNVVLMLAAIIGLVFGGAATRRPDATPRGAADWLGFVLLAVFMVSLVFALQELPHVSIDSVEVAGALALALAAFVCLLTVELRVATPLFDVRFFGDRAFAMGALIASLSMMGIMSLLLYYNLYAQSQEGLGLTPLEAGVSLLPLSAALLALAISASSTAARLGLRATIMVGMALVVIGSATLGAATVKGGFGVLAIGFFVLGAGLALPYATAPQLALSSLSKAQAGQGSGMVSACTFLGGSIGVAAGAIAFAWSGFVAVLVMLAFIGALGVALGRWIPGAARSAHPD